MHERIKKALKFPNYYGRNWNAFWDCINIDCEMELVIVKGESTVAKSLQPDIEMLNRLLEKNKQYWADCECPFDYEIVD